MSVAHLAHLAMRMLCPPLVRSGFTTFDDANGHGTHCAGIATALFNNGGIVGVAPNAEVVSVRVLDSTGSGTIASVVSGINW